ncbi:MAG: hypothetical protein ACJAQ4_000664 [Cryomorphaceae bacterium]|jgi:hypothetical protein
MKLVDINRLQLLLTMSGAVVSFFVFSQTPTYVVDQNFNSGQLFRDASPVHDVHIFENDQIIVGGNFSNWQVSPLSGLAKIFPDGSLDDTFDIELSNVLKIIVQPDGFIYPSIAGFNKILLDGTPWSIFFGEFWSDFFSGGTNNPYNVQRVWDIYQMENGDLLLGGAIGTDTLLPGLLRGVARIDAGGAHDGTFPAIDILPSNAGGAVRTIHSAPDGGWYISGGFTSINGHQTNHVARLTENFDVDTDFVSPFMYDGPVNYAEDIILVDSQNRVWVSGFQMRLQENPSDNIQIIRLLPTGEVDATFAPRKLENIYLDGWGWLPSLAYAAIELENHPETFLIHGSFSHFDDSLQPCIAAVNEAGEILPNFFQNQGATVNQALDDGPLLMPRIDVVEELENGSLLIGGAFSEFMGETRYSLVRLNQGFLSTDEMEQKGEVRVFPNPADFFIEFEYDLILPSHETLLSIYDLQGRVIEKMQLGEEPQGFRILDTRNLPNGVYIYELLKHSEQVKSGKFVIQH